MRRESAGGDRRGNWAVLPDASPASPGARARDSIGRTSFHGNILQDPVFIRLRAQASRRSLANALSAANFIDTGNVAGFESLLSQLSPGERSRALAADTAAKGGSESPSPLMIAVKRGSLSLVQVVLRWLPEEEAKKQMTAKSDHDGRTILMLAASTGIPEVFEAIASKMQKPKICEQLRAVCVMGNSLFMYAVEAGLALMVDTIAQYGTKDEVLDSLSNRNFLGETPLMHAARAPEPGAFVAVADMLSAEELTHQLSSKTTEGETPLAIAARAGHVMTWRAVAGRLSFSEVERQLMLANAYGETPMVLAVRSGNADLFRAIVGCLSGEQIKMQLGSRNKQGQTPAQVAVACGAEVVLSAMVHPAWVTACALDEPDESETKLTALDLAARPPVKLNILRCLLACGAMPSARVVIALVRNPPEALSFAGSGRGGSKERERGVKGVRDCFLGAVVGTEWEANPLIPGMNLSVALAEAINQSADVRQVLQSLRKDVDVLLLGILEHLPDTVAGFDCLSPPTTDIVTPGVAASGPTAKKIALRAPLLHASTVGKKAFAAYAKTVNVGRAKTEKVEESGVGITLVQELLEPELTGLRPKSFAGPLAQAVQTRHLELLSTPLVVDYLRLKFSAGLPNPFTQTDWRREHRRTDRDLARFVLDKDESKLRVYLLQGGCADSPSWTYLPGLQFILSGLAGKTASFFAVPAMRLALDVLVYMGVIVVFVTKVVVLHFPGTITPWEILWFGYLFGAVWQQMREVQEAGSLRTHVANPWNIVEIFTLATITVAFLFRLWAFACDGGGSRMCGEVADKNGNMSAISAVNEVYLAQYFQAASAPLVLGRVLFLTQIHSSLGPLVHSAFQMVADLARFGAIMLLIILGFALAFYAMFGSASASLPEGSRISDFDTYYTSFLTLFGSMLGNFDFHVFDNAELGEAGVVLLVFFLCIMNIMLLNLLIAILATAHSKVQCNADKEAVLSEALIITRYRRAMRSDALPSPLNVPQELIGAICWRQKERVKEVFARGVFWLLSGPVAIIGTTVLWAVSLPRTLAWAIRVGRSSGPSMLLPALLGISFSLGLAPIITGWLWIRGVVGIWYQGHGAIETSDRNEIEASRAHRRRSSVGGGLSKVSIATTAAAALAARSAPTSPNSSARRVRDQSKCDQYGRVQSADGAVTGIGTHRRHSNLWRKAVGHHKVVERYPHDGRSNNRSGYSDAFAAASGHRGFDVAATVRKIHGITIQQLRERLDVPARGIEAQLQLRDEFVVKTLQEVQKGHDRLEVMVHDAEANRARMEEKLERLISVLGQSSVGQTAASSSGGSMAPTGYEEVLPNGKVGDGKTTDESARERREGRRRESISEQRRETVSGSLTERASGLTAERNVAAAMRREDASDLDDFIDQYHTEVTSGR